MLQERTFFDEGPLSTLEGRFDRAASPITFTATGVATEVFREGGPAGPVFATCTTTETDTGVRTGA